MLLTIAKMQELQRASPPGPQTGCCPGPAGGLGSPQTFRLWPYQSQIHSYEQSLSKPNWYAIQWPY